MANTTIRMQEIFRPHFSDAVLFMQRYLSNELLHDGWIDPSDALELMHEIKAAHNGCTWYRFLDGSVIIDHGNGKLELADENQRQDMVLYLASNQVTAKVN